MRILASFTGAALVAAVTGWAGQAPPTVDTAHLKLTATISDTTAAPGERLSIVVNASPKRGMHLYAPGKHTYRVVQVTIDPPAVAAHSRYRLPGLGDLPLQAAR